jgi:hypothetical protein
LVKFAGLLDCAGEDGRVHAPSRLDAAHAARQTTSPISSGCVDTDYIA